MKSIAVLSNYFGEIEIIKSEPYNSDYEGIVLRSLRDNLIIRSRLAKLTPKKIGYFTVFWDKDSDKKNQPFYADTSPEFLVIVVSDQLKKGLFLLPKKVAAEKKIYSTNENKGKMAMRFYPSWCTGLNKTARKTQQWQAEYFINLSI